MKNIITLIAFALTCFLLSPAITATASSFPIPALGNCQNNQDCFNYCQQPENTPACWSYATYVLHKNVLGDATNSAQQSSGTHGVTFPIAELGNCSSVQACREYCSQPANYAACAAFGKKMGLYRQTQTVTDNINKEKFLEDAKTQLGCDSADACRAFCNNPANRQKCMSFAETEGLTHPSTAAKPVPPGLFEATVNALGCDSAASCKAVCSQPQNYQKCLAFAREHNLTATDSGDTRMPPPLLSITPPCTNSQSCMQWCQQNPEKCQYLKSHFQNNNNPYPSYMPDARQYDQNRFFSSGSGSLPGCTTSKECYMYCQSHPGICPGFPTSRPPLPSGYTFPRPTGTFFHVSIPPQNANNE